MKTFKKTQRLGLAIFMLLMISNFAFAQFTRVEDFETGDFSSMNWQFSGTPNSWFVEQTVGPDNIPTYSATADAIAFNDYVTLSIIKTFEAPSVVTFDLKQTEDNILIFGYTGGTQMYWPGWFNTNWQSMTIEVPAGTHEIVFTSYNIGYFGETFTMRDSLFIDNIVFPNQAFGNPAFAQIVHNAADPVLSSVDVYLNNDLILEDFTFRTATPFVELPGGAEFELAFRAANSSPSAPALWSSNYTLEQGTTYQLIAEGLLNNQGFDPFVPFGLAVYPNAKQNASIPNNTDVLIHHGSTDASIVTVAVADSVFAENLSYGDFAGYFEFSSTNLILSVLDAASANLVGSFYTPLSNYLNQSATILASGFVNPEANNNGAAFGLFLVPVAGGQLYPLPLLTEDLMNTTENFETGDFSKHNWFFDGTPGAWHIVTDSETGTLAATASHEAFNENQKMYFYGYFEEDGKMIVEVKQTSENSIVIIESSNSGIYYISNPSGTWQTVEIGVQSGFQQLSFTSYLIGVFGEEFITQNDSVLIDNIRFSSAPPILQFDMAQANYGMVPISQSKLITVNITNLTDAIMMFSSFETETDKYTAFPSNWALQPGESMPIIISFNPTEIGEFPDMLSVYHFGYMGTGVIQLPLNGEGIVMPPSNLTAVIDESTVTLNWMSPMASPDILRFGNGNPYSSIGTSSGTYEFAARFTPADLMPYSGKQLEKVGFLVHSTNANFRLKVYSGPDAENILVDMPVSNVLANTWNEFELPSAILIDELDYLWIGYEISQTTYDFIAGIDNGPGVIGKGDMLRINNNMWMTLYDYGYFNNWNIKGSIGAVPDTSSSSIDLKSKNYRAPSLIGYNVYRDDFKLNEATIQGLTYSDMVVQGETYKYDVKAVYDEGESIPSTIIVSLPSMIVMPEGWQFNATSIAHNIHIPADVLQIGFNLTPGDLIGVFYNINGVDKAAGIAQWNGSHIVLTAYGNDPGTPQKDGFDPNEIIKLKVFFNSMQTSYPINVVYSLQMPNYNGTFAMLGLSMLESMQATAVSVSENEIQGEISIHPNPNNGSFSINHLKDNKNPVKVDIYNNIGTLIFSESFSSFLKAKINLSNVSAGIYQVVTTQESNRYVNKLIIR
jgi:hypothetical protein